MGDNRDVGVGDKAIGVAGKGAEIEAGVGVAQGHDAKRAGDQGETWKGFA